MARRLQHRVQNVKARTPLRKALQKQARPNLSVFTDKHMLPILVRNAIFSKRPPTQLAIVSRKSSRNLRDPRISNAGNTLGELLGKTKGPKLSRDYGVPTFKKARANRRNVSDKSSIFFDDFLNSTVCRRKKYLVKNAVCFAKPSPKLNMLGNSTNRF